MLTSNRVAGIVLFSLAACLPGTRIGAFEGTDGARVDKAPLQTFATPRAALQAGIEVFRSGGDASSAIEALKFAARGGKRWRGGSSPKFMPMATGFRATISRLMIIFPKSRRIMTRTTRTGATSRSCRVLLSRLGFII